MNPFHASILAALAPKGLTSDHINQLLEDGYETPSQVLRISVSELKVLLDIKGGLASDILSIAEAVKSSDFETAQVNEDAVIRTLLENLVGAPTIRTAAVQGLLERGVHLVVINEARALAWKETLRFLASPDRRVAESHRLWNDMALVDVQSFLPDLTPLRSPYSEEALVEGRDVRTGVLWGTLPRDRLGLAVWAVQEKMDAGRPQQDVFQDFLDGGALYQRALKLSAVKGLSEGQLRQLALHQPRVAGSTWAYASALSPPKVVNRTPISPRKALYDLLLSLFSGRELRDLATLSSGISSHDLPGGNASAAELASALLEAQERMSSFDHAFFEVLLRERPRRKNDIDQVRALFF